MKQILLKIQKMLCAVILSTMAMTIASIANAQDCACCAEAGTTTQKTVPVDPELQILLADLMNKFGATADLSFPAAGLESVKGIASAAKTYKVSLSLQPSYDWGIQLTGPGGKSGVLKIEMPRLVVESVSDPQDGKQAGSGGALLKKELSFTGKVIGTGILSQGIDPGTRFRLVFKGRGNRCRNIADFTAWSLRITGAKADYALSGSLQTAVAGFSTYFASPAEAVSVITDLMRKEDWLKLGRYHDHAGMGWRENDMQDSAFYLHQIKPENTHPAIDWKYKYPFAPGFKFESVEDAPQVGVVRVILRFDIDAGGGTKQTRLAVLLLRQSDKGYQLIPPDPKPPLKPEFTGGLTRLEAAKLARVFVDMERHHGFFCPLDQTWFFVRTDGTGVALRKKVSPGAVINPNAGVGYEWKSEPFDSAKTLCPR